MAKQGASTVVPRLRFPEFRGDGGWAIQSLNEFAEFLKGKGLPKDTIVANGKYPCIHYGQLFLDYSEVIEDVLSRTNSGDGAVLSRENDVLMPTSDVTPRGLAKASCIRLDDVILGGDILVIRANETEVDGTFLARQIRSLEQKVLQLVTGTTVFHLYSSALGKLQLTMPTFAEQQKIADCLTSLDAVTAAQGRKVEALKAHKRGLMQQLFPREGETRPRLRFPEFRSAPEWQRMPLGKVAEIKLGKMLDANKHMSGRLLPYVNNISLRWNEVDTSELPQMYFKETELERYSLKEGDVLVCEGGEPGRSAVWDGRLPDLKFQKAIHRVRFQVPFVPKILVLYLEAIAGTNAFESLFTGGGIKHLTGETFAKLAIPVMPLPEQQRIANCLFSLDTQITAEANQLAALKTHKRGLMQQLFPAPETSV